MAATTRTLQRMLDDAWDERSTILDDGSSLLRAALRAKEKAAGELLEAGSIASVSKNSASQTYAYGNGALTQKDIAEGWRELINLFDTVAGVIASATDEAIVCEMRARLRASANAVYRLDFSGLRCA